MIELILFFAGFFGGIMNALAGGGSGLTFTALVFAGLPPITANATNTLAATIGYITGAIGYREQIWAAKEKLIWQVPVAIIGGLLGGWVLLNVEERLFSTSVPWLLLFATILFWVAPYFTASARRADLARHGMIAAILLFLVCVYGGYFQAGFGILTLGVLALTGYTNLAQMNGLKLIFATVSSVAAIVLFIAADAIQWSAGISVMIGIALGSYVAARIATKIADRPLKIIISVISLGVTAYFFWQVYRVEV